MKHILRKHIIRRLGTKPARLDLFVNCFQETKAKKDQVLLEINETCKYCYFVVKGALVSYVYNSEGIESEVHLAHPKQWRTSVGSFLHQQPSNERIIAMENSELLFISQKQFQTLSQQFPEFEYIYNDVLKVA